MGGQVMDFYELPFMVISENSDKHGQDEGSHYRIILLHVHNKQQANSAMSICVYSRCESAAYLLWPCFFSLWHSFALTLIE